MTFPEYIFIPLYIKKLKSNSKMRKDLNICFKRKIKT